MNKNIIKRLGFGLKVELVEKKACTFCYEPIPFGLLSFEDELSYKEYKISGLCQICQDKTFKICI